MWCMERNLCQHWIPKGLPSHEGGQATSIMDICTRITLLTPLIPSRPSWFLLSQRPSPLLTLSLPFTTDMKPIEFRFFFIGQEESLTSTSFCLAPNPNQGNEKLPTWQSTWNGRVSWNTIKNINQYIKTSPCHSFILQHFMDLLWSQALCQPWRHRHRAPPGSELSPPCPSGEDRHGVT